MWDVHKRDGHCEVGKVQRSNTRKDDGDDDECLHAAPLSRASTSSVSQEIPHAL